MNFGLSLLRHYQKQSRPLVCILPSAQECEHAISQLKFFAKGLDIRLIYLPPYELNEEDQISPSQHIVATRIQTLSKLYHEQFDIMITSVDATIRQLPPIDFVKKSVYTFHKNQAISPLKIIQQLAKSGFSKQAQVDEPMSFARRGEILDIFLPQLSYPIRIVFDDDCIESIMRFDPQTQRSESEVDKIAITPAHEYNLEDARLISSKSDPFNNALKNDHLITAWQHHLDRLHPKLNHLLEFLPKSAQLLCFGDLKPLLTQQILHTSLRLDAIDLNSSQLLIEEKTVEQICSKAIKLEFNSNSLKQLLTFKDKDFKPKLTALIDSHQVLIACQNHYRYHELEQILLQNQIDFSPTDSWIAFSSQNVRIGVCMGFVEDVIEIDSLKQYIIPEHSLSEQIISNKTEKKANFISHSNLKEGDFLVHEDHGIGRFIGIETRTIAGTIQDLVAIEYANNDKLLFLPHLLYKIHPYYGSDAQLDQLKSDRWQKRKKKAQLNIEQFAANLLQETASRQQYQIQPMAIPLEYKSFTDEFSFTDTNDQYQIMQDIITDCKKNVLFDRLVCGDVGFGKTEIALRAAFITTMNAYQVLVLAPTTVLANQHFQTFKERYKHWPINITLLTRAHQKSVESISNGKADIIIGTHKALHISYKKLGLVIIDEEHRFGVKQKDNINAFRHAHRLSLTATPIPRSLNMALSKFRKISMMHEAPKKRLPIITYVGEEDQTIIRSAIEREIRRGGQVYILVNEVQKIPQMIENLEKLYPYARFGALHGQMHTDAIERQMARFHAQSFQVLVASTIIEAGIDIPNANTLIVFRADRLGLAQMHQIRGRIGRSHHQGFAYFLTPKDKTISSDSQMRLDAIKNHTSLGAGIKLALADLEIRGAGNLLGAEQSGHVHAIGIAMYTALLNKALPSSQNEDFTTEIKINISTHLPQNYIEQSTLRYEFYHRIANAKDEVTLIKISDEMNDRFGKMPDSVRYLIQSYRLKKIAQLKKIKAIHINEASLSIHYGESSQVCTKKILTAIKQPNVELCGPTSLKCYYSDSFYQVAANLIEQTTLPSDHH
ncbi:helicase-related protein [Gammaproteobacteria bacterium]|nr:helicase-related protein [Gammaproteobacteria bacterium]